MHPTSLVSNTDSDDNADVDGEKTLPTETPPKNSQRRSMKQDLWDRNFLLPADKNVVSVFGSHEPFT